MLIANKGSLKGRTFAVALILSLSLWSAVPASAEVRSVDPSAAATAPVAAANAQATAASKSAAAPDVNADLAPTDTTNPVTTANPADVQAGAAEPPVGKAATFHKDDLIGAAEGVFGKGAKGLGQIVEKILKDQGEPDGYIAGREASGAFVVGLRYGSGIDPTPLEPDR